MGAARPRSGGVACRARIQFLHSDCRPDYLLGITQSKEYAEPEWYADPWLTIVWVISPGLLGTIMRRKEPHIYVANWFYPAFIVTIAVLAVCAWR